MTVLIQYTGPDNYGTYFGTAYNADGDKYKAKPILVEVFGTSPCEIFEKAVELVTAKYGNVNVLPLRHPL